MSHVSYLANNVICLLSGKQCHMSLIWQTMSHVSYLGQCHMSLMWQTMSHVSYLGQCHMSLMWQTMSHVSYVANNVTCLLSGKQCHMSLIWGTVTCINYSRRLYFQQARCALKAVDRTWNTFIRCTLLLCDQKQCMVRNLPKVFTHDQFGTRTPEHSLSRPLS
jgi:hypothetical protein